MGSSVQFRVSVVYVEMWRKILLLVLLVLIPISSYGATRLDSRGRMQMGDVNKQCDDGKSHLEVDWLDDPQNYTCYHPERRLLPHMLQPTLECEELPGGYYPKHFCMTDKLQYVDAVPHHGDHRPVWPKFGEYKFVPVQRWLHNIEHGAVVMLYHPCTHYTLVDKLRKIVTGCIRKHIITPYHALSENQPLALVAWGCRLLMSDANEKTVVEFIQQKGLKGPEGTYPKEGQYTHQLIHLATAPPGSDMNDSVLCPKQQPTSPAVQANLVY